MRDGADDEQTGKQVEGHTGVEAGESSPADGDWYAQVKRYTLELVQIASVSPTAQENAVTAKVIELLTEDGLADGYEVIGLDPLPHDAPHHRANAYALLRGRSAKTVVLLGHIDVVGVDDYQELAPLAFHPDELTRRFADLRRMDDALQAEFPDGPGDWLFGRGVADMKGGVAANIAVMRRLAAQQRAGELPLSVLVVATPDEENESAGVLAATDLLLRLRAEHGLEYLGVLNTDYTTWRYPGDPARYAYTGTIGKLLPSFLVMGRESHVGLPFDGLDANLLAAELIRDLSMNPDLCDLVPGANGAETLQSAPPPVTLHATDLKTEYNVQLPFAAHFYLNLLTLTTTPAELLERLCAIAEDAVTRVLARVEEQQRRWLARMRAPEQAPPYAIPHGQLVYTYADLYALAVARHGAEVMAAEVATLSAPPTADVAPGASTVDPALAEQARAFARRVHGTTDDEAHTAQLADELLAWAAKQRTHAQPRAAESPRDSRARSLAVVRRLWTLSGATAPAVVIYYSPPYYPHVAGPQAGESPLHTALGAAAAAYNRDHADHPLVVDEFYPYISDMSYLRLDLTDPDRELAALKANMPLWRDPPVGDEDADPAGYYSLPLARIQALDLPLVNIGPYGRGVHQRGEATLAPYSFEDLPQLMWDTIERLGRMV